MNHPNRTERAPRGRRLVGLVGIAGATLGLGIVSGPAPASAAPSDDCLLILCPNGEIEIDLEIDLDLPTRGDENRPEPPPPTQPPPPQPTPTTVAPGGLEVDVDLAADVDLGNLVDIDARVPVDLGVNGRGSGGPALVDADVVVEPEAEVELLPQPPAVDDGVTPDPGDVGPTEPGGTTSALADLDADLVCGLSILAIGPSNASCGGDIVGTLSSGLVDANLDVGICDVSVSLLAPTEQAACSSAADDDDDTDDDGTDDDGTDDDGTDDDGTD
ncbi:hypothetical protein, partial [Ilumatobacter nonamiensis]|uniref:hypothetical protein n=1 Tax=Ilumatobacter nonamiensis TaxID=467093 RepID=UPI0005915B56